MAHEIGKYDDMFSVREVPWHGLGNVLEDHPTVPEAKKASGLWWTASLERMKVPMEIAGMSVDIEVPNQFAIVRNDIHSVLGVVGNRYEIYQNDEMWAFIQEFMNQNGMKLETAGSLRNGQMTWVLGKGVRFSVLGGDPIDQYFLFRNSFDGSTPISVLFTNIRVVCNNTLTAALKGASNIFNVRHTKNASDQVREVQTALGIQAKYDGEMREALLTMHKYKMGSVQTEEFVENEIFQIPTQLIQTVGEDDEKVQTSVELSKQAETMRNNKIEKVLELVETGAGSDIPGVRGTAYGLYNALTEFADHEKTLQVRSERNISEVRFENAFFGTNAAFKNNCFQKLLKIAA